MKLSSLG